MEREERHQGNPRIPRKWREKGDPRRSVGDGEGKEIQSNPGGSRAIPGVQDNPEDPRGSRTIPRVQGNPGQSQKSRAVPGIQGNPGDPGASPGSPALGRHEWQCRPRVAQLCHCSRAAPAASAGGDPSSLRLHLVFILKGQKDPTRQPLFTWLRARLLPDPVVEHGLAKLASSRIPEFITSLPPSQFGMWVGFQPRV